VRCGLSATLHKGSIESAGLRDRSRTQAVRTRSSAPKTLHRSDQAEFCATPRPTPSVLERGSTAALHKRSIDPASPLLTRAPAVTPSLLGRGSTLPPRLGATRSALRTPKAISAVSPGAGDPERLDAYAAKSKGSPWCIRNDVMRLQPPMSPRHRSSVKKRRARARAGAERNGDQARGGGVRKVDPESGGHRRPTSRSREEARAVDLQQELCRVFRVHDHCSDR